MIDCGMKHVTLAEATFVFNLISRFQTTMNFFTFNNWLDSMFGLAQKQLIQYSQYLNVATMRMESPEDFEKNRLG